MTKRLYKSDKNRMICGVCGGIAEYFNIDPTIVRLVLVILCFIMGSGVLLYIIAALIIPSKDPYFDEENVDNLKSANYDSYEENKNKSSRKTTSRKSKIKPEKNHNENSSSGHSDSDFDKYFEK